jgi:hypothetical protein
MYTATNSPSSRALFRYRLREVVNVSTKSLPRQSRGVILAKTANMSKIKLESYWIRVVNQTSRQTLRRAASCPYRSSFSRRSDIGNSGRRVSAASSSSSCFMIWSLLDISLCVCAKSLSSNWVNCNVRSCIGSHSFFQFSICSSCSRAMKPRCGYS